MKVITRFAPSPTGFLHIGGARTALFNWLFARHHGGKFLLRIEDTDRERSTKPAIDAIIEGLNWLGLKCDGEPIFQFARSPRHREVAEELIRKGKAYNCYVTPEELADFRAKNPHAIFNSPWRDSAGKTPPNGVKPTVRIRVEKSGETVIEDKVQGKVRVQNSQLDDMVLLRSDGTPTYMLAVVVDDNDMGITHVIRGDDHLTNAFRQLQIYNAMGWEVPNFSHVPMIHGADGAKLSKRHGALGVEAYRDMGYLPEALRNYLLRLGWSHGDDEIIHTKQAIEWFNLDNIGKSASRFDFAKLEHLNGHYIRETENDLLISMMKDALEKRQLLVTSEGLQRIARFMNQLKERAKTIVELADSAEFLIKRPNFSDAAKKLLDNEGRANVAKVKAVIENLGNWQHKEIEAKVKEMVEKEGLKLGKILPPVRAALTASNVSPGVFEVMEVLGKKEALERLDTLE